MQELVATTVPSQIATLYTVMSRWSLYLMVPVFYLLRCVEDPLKLLSKFAPLNPIKRWVHVVPEWIRMDSELGLQINKYDGLIMDSIIKFEQPKLFEAMLDTWPTLATRALSFDWDCQWDDNISHMIYHGLWHINYFLIAIRHGLDVNIIPDYHVLDKLLVNTRFVSHRDPWQLNLLPLLVTYGLSDFICEHGTPMKFILHFMDDQDFSIAFNNWRGTEIYFAMLTLESAGYQYMLPEGLIKIEIALKNEWVDQPRKAELMKEHLDRIMNRPLTLTEISRNKIRSNLGGSYLCIKATQLGLPPALVKVVTMEDIRNSLLFKGLSPAEI